MPDGNFQDFKNAIDQLYVPVGMSRLLKLEFDSEAQRQQSLILVEDILMTNEYHNSNDQKQF